MKKFSSFLVAFFLIFITIAPIADASVRIRRGYTAPAYMQYSPTQPVYQASQMYQPTQVYKTSIGDTYYYSSTYVQGYTYYSVPTPGYYYYSNIPTATSSYNTTTNTQQGQYYFSQNYIQGYTYYSTPNPGYYYYFNTSTTNNYNPVPTVPYNNPNMICTIINSRYQCVANTYANSYATYPGCSAPDIVIGGQIWASCNALDRNAGSVDKSGWFFAGDRESSFTAYNSANSTLEWMGKQTRESSWNVGPCAPGYRLPNRSEWETLQSYARAGNTTISNLISLKQNGSYQGSRNTNGDIVITGRLSATAAYWSSSVDGGVPVVMHVGSTYQGYNTTGTDYGYVNNAYQWTYSDTGLSLLRSTTGELANVRCIK